MLGDALSEGDASQLPDAVLVARICSNCIIRPLLPSAHLSRSIAPILHHRHPATTATPAFVYALAKMRPFSIGFEVSQSFRFAASS
jgi:hypothetical protein